MGRNVSQSTMCTSESGVEESHQSVGDGGPFGVGVTTQESVKIRRGLEVHSEPCSGPHRLLG